MTTPTPPVLSVIQTASRLGVHRRTVLRMIRDEELPAVKMGQNTSAWAVDSEAVEALVEKRAEA